MGWPKYYEDNVSICIGRMAVETSFPKYYVQSCEVKRVIDRAAGVVNPKYDSVDRPKNQNGRRGLELVFARKLEKKLVLKLQMNGWWWSCGNHCWCNLDTAGNRKYAQHMISMVGARLAMVNS